MSLKTISKLKLVGNQTMKLATIRESYWLSLESIPAVGWVDHADRYLTGLGDNVRFNTTGGSTKVWTLDNDNGSTLSLTLPDVQTFTYVLQPPPEIITEDYQGFRALSFDFFATPTTNVINFYTGDQAIIQNTGNVYFAAAIDEETNRAYTAIVYENITYQRSKIGKYSMYIVVGYAPNPNEWLNGAFDDSTDPYDPNDGENKGGDGDKDGGSDDNPIPDLPAIGAIDTGFVTLFNPTINQLKSLANYMWSDTFDLNNFKKLFANPMDAILGLTMLPVNVPSVTSGPVKIGNISTGVTMNYVSNQYMKVNCGSIAIKEFWGAYLDYSPMTKIEIYLPYIGTRSLSADDVMGKTIKVEYNVDVLTGACVAHILCGSSVLYEFAGQCGIQIPINGNNFNSMISSAVSAAVAVGTAAVAIGTGGAAAPVAAGAAISGAGAIANSVMSSKGEVQRSGSMGNSAGLLGHQKPYLIITRPRQCVASNQNKFEGYPSYQNKKLSSCSGYTQILQIHLENIPATDAEKLEIERLLMEGVII